MSQQAAKRAVGEAAAGLVSPGMRIGLGTGSTTAEALSAIGARIRGEGLDVAGVPTSFAAERLAREHGIPLIGLEDVDELDLAIDGADEVFVADSGRIDLIKGRGAAHTRERVVASCARRFVVLADASKRVDALCSRMPVPVEFLPMALAPVERGLRALGGEPVLRMAERKDGPVVTDQGFWVIDARFSPTRDATELSVSIRSLPGVLDHGLFLGMASEVLVGEDDGSVTTIPAGSPEQG